MSDLTKYPICPGARPGQGCRGHLCDVHGCLRLGDPRPIDLINQPRPALHFVGFRGEEYARATPVFGLPDFIHRGWDPRAQREVGPHDLVIFGPKADPDHVSEYNFDDSNEPDDPAPRERLER